jgi:hypothetical protein
VGQRRLQLRQLRRRDRRRRGGDAAQADPARPADPDRGRRRRLHGLAEARPAAALDGIRPPVRPSVEEAAAASADSPFRGADHTYPGCFVCGPEHPDGLEIFVGPLEQGPDGREAFADSFTIEPALAEADGNAGPGLVWAALDCPSYVPPYWAYAPVLLGRLTAEQLAPVPTGEPLVAVSWPLEVEGRKLHSASAVLDRDGEILARARALWIQLRQPLAS